MEPLPQHLQPADDFREMAAVVVRDTPTLRDYLARCEAIGLPVADRLAVVNANHEFCQKFLEHFFPSDM